jgi:transcriptional regulator with XRE-family HTH domain
MNRRKASATTVQLPEFSEIQAAAPTDLLMMADMSIAIAHYVNKILSDEKMSQRELAEKMEKSEAEVSKLLSGTHNLTLRSIAKIQVALGRKVILVPKMENGTSCLTLPKLDHRVRFIMTMPAKIKQPKKAISNQRHITNTSTVHSRFAY